MRQILELVPDETFPYAVWAAHGEADLTESYRQAYSRVSDYVHGNHKVESLDVCFGNVRLVVDVSCALLLERFGRRETIEQGDWSEFLHHVEQFRFDATEKVIPHIGKRRTPCIRCLVGIA